MFTVFGDVVRPAGGEVWLTALTECMRALGFTAEATRTALHRMAAEGWVEPRRVGRYATYRLTQQGIERLEEAAARIYRLRAADWDGHWRLVFSGEIGRNRDLARELQWMGFGRLATDAWISPHDHADRVSRLLARHGIGGAHEFVGQAAGTDAAMVASAWDLGALRTAHGDFIGRWEAAESPAEPAEAFTTRIRLVHDWRSFLFIDPGLPAALLPPNWTGDRAARVFARLYDAVAEPAWRFYEDLASSAPATVRDWVPSGRRDQDVSPFAAGLRALGNGNARRTTAARRR